MSAELIAVLCCPATRQRLRVATAEELARAGVAEGLAREDGLVVYPIREEIAMLLVEHGLSVAAG